MGNAVARLTLVAALLVGGAARAQGQVTPPAKLPAPAVPGAQPAPSSDRCRFQIDFVGDTGARQETATGINYFAGGGVRLSCQNKRISITSDSVAAYGGKVVEFLRNVHYEDSTIAMDADRGTYYRDGERWEARGRVKTRSLESGSTIEGPSLDYLRKVQGVRDTFEMIAVGRPTIHYFTKDSTGAPGNPYVIVADRVRVRGDTKMWGNGKVTIDRSDFAARGDSLRLDTGPANDGTLLRGEPMLRGLGTDSFTLKGRRIDFKLDGRELTYVKSQGQGHAISKDVDLVGDTIAIDVNSKKLEHIFAWGDSIRPYAVAPRYSIRGDSIALHSPVEQLEEAEAFGTAWVGGAIDSASQDRDWITGDTVYAHFGQADSVGKERTIVKSIESRGTARSYYRAATSDSARKPSINYARANLITITLGTDSANKVERVDLHGDVDGVQLEPYVAPDSLADSPKTPGVPADSAGVAPSTTPAPSDSTPPPRPQPKSPAAPPARRPSTAADAR